MLRFMLAALFTAAATMTTSAQVTIWDNPGTGDWFDAGNWTAGVPTTGDFAWIQNGGTIEISSGITDVCHWPSFRSYPQITDIQIPESHSAKDLSHAKP